VAQLALAWSIANTDVSTAIFGSSSLAQLEDNFGALEARSQVP
jgi:aryl-alcohol dehydrogenase-like predicted oxidoreductase